jgi:hypothetical protein
LAEKRRKAAVLAPPALLAGPIGPVSGLIYINMRDRQLRDHGGQQDSGQIALMGPAKAAILPGVIPVTFSFEDMR